jgi:hypothetical protein
MVHQEVLKDWKLDGFCEKEPSVGSEITKEIPS